MTQQSYHDPHQAGNRPRILSIRARLLVRVLTERRQLLDQLEPLEGPVRPWQLAGSSHLERLDAQLDRLRALREAA